MSILVYSWMQIVEGCQSAYRSTVTCQTLRVQQHIIRSQNGNFLIGPFLFSIRQLGFVMRTAPVSAKVYGACHA